MNLLICLEIPIEEFDGALHRQAEVVRDVMIIAVVTIKLYNLICLLHFIVEHFRKLPRHLLIGGTMVKLDRCI